MRIKKLTLAAAITVSLMTIAVPSVWAGCGCDTDCGTPVGSACPLSGCPKTITPENAPCPVCQQPACDCGCDIQEAYPSDCGCDPCEKKSDCECADEISCDTPMPTTAICPNVPDCGCKKLNKQVYSYPSAIYDRADSVAIGDRGNNLMIGDMPLQAATGGVVLSDSMSGCTTGAAMPIINDCGCGETGAAAPVINDCINGIQVERNNANFDGAGCPVEISTQTSMEVIKKKVLPYAIPETTGAAAPFTVSMFDDVPMDFWASCDINRLAETKVLAGYPDRTFKPNLPISRAEFASVIVNGYNLDKLSSSGASHNFKDVKKDFWAKKYIDQGVGTGYMAGFPDNTFRPHKPVSRAEALTMLAKGINCDMDECKADEILSKYCDADEVPYFAKIPIAKAIESGALKNLPQNNVIAPNKDASRAEIASMVQDLRVAMGYDSTAPKTALTEDCGCTTGAAAYIEQDSIVTIPTLKLSMNDIINSKNAQVGDHFSATTLDCLTLNGVTYPAGSTVHGQVMEVVRPSGCDQGALKLSFNYIQHEKCKANLPAQVLTAQVNKCKTANAFARLIAMPFSWTGQIIGTAGRTVGGAATAIANAAENVLSGIGTGSGELLTGQFKASGRSFYDAGRTLVQAPVDLTRTAVSGVTGIFQATGDEFAYLVDSTGTKVSQVNPKEKLTIAFGCK